MEHLPVVPHDKVLHAGLQVVLAGKNVEQRGLLSKQGIKKEIDYSFAPSNQAWWTSPGLPGWLTSWTEISGRLPMDMIMIMTTIEVGEN